MRSSTTTAAGPGLDSGPAGQIGYWAHCYMTPAIRENSAAAHQSIRDESAAGKRLFHNKSSSVILGSASVKEVYLLYCWLDGAVQQCFLYSG